MEVWHGTTIIGVRKNGKAVIAGDGQVSLQSTVIKPNAKKVRRIGATDKEGRGKVIGGFAGATADAFTLFERDVWDVTPDPADIARILARHDRFFGRLRCTA